MSQSPHIPLPMARPPVKMPQFLTFKLDDGYQTGALVHMPPGPVRLGVLYLHGIQSHPGWFAGSAAALAACGCAVYQVERRGSGHNIVDRGHARSAEQLLADVDAAARWVLSQTGAAAVALVGVSWGGKLAAAYAAWPGRRVELASLTMVAPGIAAQVDVGLATKLAVAANLLLRPGHLMDIPLNDVELFTDNPAMRDYLRGDPLRLRQASAAFMYASRRLDGMIRRARRGAITAATSLLLARRERIIDNERTLRRVAALTDGKARVQMFDAAHVLEFESDPSAFYAAMAGAVQGRA